MNIFRNRLVPCTTSIFSFQSSILKHNSRRLSLSFSSPSSSLSVFRNNTLSFFPSQCLSTSASSSSKTKRSVPSIEVGDDYLLPHPIWAKDYSLTVNTSHLKPNDFVDKFAYYAIKLIRFNFDWMTGFIFGTRTQSKWLTRIIFLESIAAVPGSIGGTLRHLASLRKLKRDHGWIHTLLEEAENERMHLMIAIQLKQPGKFFRGSIWVAQGVFFNFFFLLYLVSPRCCHRLVGYLEEEAVYTYGKLIDDINSGLLSDWSTQKAPEIAQRYWRMEPNSTILDMFLNFRADEAHHRDVNHNFASLKPDQDNPYKPGY